MAQTAKTLQPDGGGAVSIRRSEPMPGMSFFSAKDGSVYRRWINVICSALISGGGQFLSGRKAVGVSWFLTDRLLTATAYFIYLSPLVKSFAVFKFFTIFAMTVWVVMLIESCRTPIPRLNLKVWTAYVLVVIAIPVVPALVIRQFFFQPFSIPTGTMQPTLMGDKKTPFGVEKTGDHIFVSKMAYWFHQPQRGEIVVFSTEGIDQFSMQPGEEYVKRVVGIPGDTVSIRPPNVLINGKILDEPPVFRRISAGANGYSGYTNALLLATDTNTIDLGKDEYFVLGDNSQNSLDGRYFGAIKRQNIKGKVVLIYWPFDRKAKPE
jgi:signal peptidase I